MLDLITTKKIKSDRLVFVILLLLKQRLLLSLFVQHSVNRFLSQCHILISNLMREVVSK